MAEIPVSQYEIPKEVRELTTSSYNRAMEGGPESYSSGLLRGTQIEPSYDLTNTLNEAIARRSRRGYDVSQAQLGAQADRFGQQMQAQRLSKVNKLLQDEKQLNDQIREMKERAEMDRRAARASILGNILGVGGALAGGAVGGPAGAMAGYGIGTGVGQGVGGSL